MFNNVLIEEKYGVGVVGYFVDVLKNDRVQRSILDEILYLFNLFF